MNDLMIVGGGGHGVSILDLLAKDKYCVSGFVDNNPDAALSKLRIKYLGSDQNLPDLIKITPNCVIGVGQINKPDIRMNIAKILISLGAQFPIIKSKWSLVSENATLGIGTVIFHNAVVNINAVIGDFNIINTSATIEHGARIEDFVHIAPGAIVLGDCFISEGCFIGAGAVIREGVRIGKNSIIGAGAVIKHDIRDGQIIT